MIAKMPEQFQCRFCPESYKEVLGFLDHFETHMNQNEQQNDDRIPNDNSPTSLFIEGTRQTKHVNKETESDLCSKENSFPKNEGTKTRGKV